MTRPELRDRHKGRKCYIFGAGPSLNRFDCDKLALDGVTICCNSSIMALKQCDYFMLCDPGVMDEKAYCTTIFDKADTVVAGNYEIHDLCLRVFGPEVSHRIELPSPQRRGMVLGFNFSQYNILIGGASVVEVATHFAYVMGCSPIILVGVDLRWDGDRKYFHDRSDEALWPPLRDGENSIADRSLDEAFDVWRQIKRENPDLPIFVANTDSKLSELWPCIDLSEFHKELSATEDRKDANG